MMLVKRSLKCDPRSFFFNATYVVTRKAWKFCQAFLVTTLPALKMKRKTKIAKITYFKLYPQIGNSISKPLFVIAFTELLETLSVFVLTY